LSRNAAQLNFAGEITLQDNFIRFFGIIAPVEPPIRMKSKQRTSREPGWLGAIRSFFTARAPVFCVALATLAIVTGYASASRETSTSAPPVDHILLEISNMKTSLTFYHDFLGLPVESNDGHFAMLAAGNLRIALWDKHWDWEAPRTKGERLGLGMYPHLKVANVSEVVNRARVMGYKIVQKPRHYLWGAEAFVADPDGYVWALVN
jgi:catechol 2,3-dioxygenase-like lactoylglutathione lyase family enzyme